MEIMLENTHRWDGSRGGVVLQANVGGTEVRFFVAREVLHAIYPNSNKDDLLEQLGKSRFKLETLLVSHLHGIHVSTHSGSDEPEISILVRPREFDPSAQSNSHHRRVTADQLMGSQVAVYANDSAWWQQAARYATSIEVRGTQTDLFFPSEQAAEAFEYKMHTFGVPVWRIYSAG